MYVSRGAQASAASRVETRTAAGEGSRSSVRAWTGVKLQGSRYLGGLQSFGKCRVAQLRVAVVAPAVADTDRSRCPAGMIAAAAQLGEQQAACNGNRCETCSCSSVAQLAVGVRAPAVGLPRSQAAGMRGAGEDLVEAERTGNRAG